MKDAETSGEIQVNEKGKRRRGVERNIMESKRKDQEFTKEKTKIRRKKGRTKEKRFLNNDKVQNYIR